MRWIRPAVIEIRFDNLELAPEVKAPPGIVVLSISGQGVTSRSLGGHDPFMSRLKVNSTLVWTEYHDHVCYMPSTVLGPIKAQLSSCFIAGIVIGATAKEAFETSLRLKEEYSNMKTVVSSSQLRRFLLQHLYRTARLPILIFWLLILVGNYLLSSRLGGALNAEYQKKQLNEIRQRNRQEVTSQQKKMIADYQGLILPKSSIALDRIAAVLPDGICLNKMELVGNHVISVSGNASELSGVLKYSDALKELFGAVEIRSMETRSNGSGYSFDIQIRQ